MHPLEPATGAAVAIWVAYRGRDAGRLLNLSAKGIYRACYRLGKAAAVTTRCNPHSFRHSCLNRAIEKTGDIRAVQELAGHKSVSTTEHYWKKLKDQRLKLGTLLSEGLQCQPKKTDEPKELQDPNDRPLHLNW